MILKIKSFVMKIKQRKKVQRLNKIICINLLFKLQRKRFKKF